MIDPVTLFIVIVTQTLLDWNYESKDHDHYERHARYVDLKIKIELDKLVGQQTKEKRLAQIYKNDQLPCAQYLVHET